MEVIEVFSECRVQPEAGLNTNTNETQQSTTFLNFKLVDWYSVTDNNDIYLHVFI